MEQFKAYNTDFADYRDSYRSLDEKISIQCLLPNGILIDLTVSMDISISKLKIKILDVAKVFPFHEKLLDPSIYYLHGLIPTDQELDENEKLSDQNFAYNILNLVEIEGEAKKSLLVKNINKLLDRSNKLEEENESDEIINLRITTSSSLRIVCHSSYDDLEKFKCFYPLKLDRNKFEFEKKSFMIKVLKGINNFVNFTFYLTDSASSLINRVNGKIPCDVLKVCGQEQYIYSDSEPLSNLKYIRDKLKTEDTPIFYPYFLKDIPLIDNEEMYREVEEEFKRKATWPNDSKISSWEVLSNYELIIKTISGLESDCSKVLLYAGLYHGEVLLENTIESVSFPIKSLNMGNLGVQLRFKISIAQIPRAAKLCLGLYKLTSNDKPCSNGQIGWANAMVFNYKGYLNTTHNFHIWKYRGENINCSPESLLKPINPVDQDIKNSNAVELTLEYMNNLQRKIIHYPKSSDLCPTKPKPPINEPQKTLMESYHLYSEEFRNKTRPLKGAHTNDAFKSMGVNDDDLSYMLRTINWKKHSDVKQITCLIVNSNIVPVDFALRFLDPINPNQQLRYLATKSLDVIQDDDLILLMLNLVEALKYDTYIDSPLTKFLLKKATRNVEFGNRFFWHLYSEIVNTEEREFSVAQRFSVILDVFLRNSAHLVQILLKQKQCLKRMTKATEIEKEKKDAGIKNLEDHNSDFKELCNPLNILEKCREFKSAKAFSSKTKPIRIVFHNFDVFEDKKIDFIFKIGDDLRQDVFTLQILEVMDRIWKAECMDFRMNIYGVLPMGSRTGIVETVDAITLADIQREKGTFGKNLYNWLKANTNDDEYQMKKVVEDFTLSTIGYCVSTFILGVADRHSDNIMIKKNGQMFHIDFGHILGNFKTKCGIKREHVPFILTKDFVDVICEGDSKVNKANFQRLQEDLMKAYETILKHKDLILTLFRTGLLAGLPEVNEPGLKYLNDKISLDRTLDEAREFFKSQFHEVISKDTLTSINFWCHNMAHK